MSADMRYAIDNLARSARSAPWDMTVNTALVRKLIAAAELAEAVVSADDAIDYGADPGAASIYDIAVHNETVALAAYRKATRP